jgi:Mg2+-importing ATPase
MAISTDRVEPARGAPALGPGAGKRYMVVFGLVSSVFDLLTFAALLLVFHADGPTFQTSWFVVSS